MDLGDVFIEVQYHKGTDTCRRSHPHQSFIDCIHSPFPPSPLPLSDTDLNKKDKHTATFSRCDTCTTYNLEVGNHELGYTNSNPADSEAPLSSYFKSRD